MKKQFLSILLGFTTIACMGQYTFAPTLVSSCGHDSLVGGIELSYSVGEPVIETFQNPGPPPFFLTQGFHQPNTNNALDFVLNHFDESCLGSKDGKAFIQIVGGAAPYDIVWSSDPTLNNNSIDSLVPGNYTVTVTDAHGLIKKETFSVLASEITCKITIFTGITPNGDGHNDTWIIENIDQFPDNSVGIYNRWGSEVWQANGYDNTKVVWKGDDSKGAPLPDATYFYLVKVNGTTYKGWVQLTR